MKLDRAGKGFGVVERKKVADTDIDLLVKIDLECFSESEAYDARIFRELLSQPGAVAFKALSNGEIFSFIIGGTNGKKGVIYTLNVRPQFRRAGAGTALLLRFEEELRKKGCDEIHLQTHVNNVPARRLFSKFGYEISGIIKDYYAPGIDAFEMTMKI